MVSYFSISLKTSVSLANDTRSTDYYLISGNPETVIGNLDTEFFPTFSDKYPSRLYPGEHLTRDQLTGTYLIDGASQDSQVAVDALSQLGITSTSVHSKPGYVLWVFFLVGDGWATALAILLLCLLLSLCQLQSVRLAIVSVRTTAGELPLSVSLREIGALLLPVYFPLVVSNIFLALYSLLSADGYRLNSIGIIAIQQGIILTSTLIISIVIIRAWTAKYSLGALNKGRRPLTLLGALSSILVLVAFLGSMVSISNTLTLKNENMNESYADTLRNEHTDLVQPILGYALLSSQADVAKEQLGNMFAQLEADQASYLVSKNPLPDSPLSASDNILLANPNYMRTFTQLDSSLLDKVASTAQEESTIAVVIPQKYSQHETEIITQVKNWADFQQEMGGNFHSTTNIKIYSGIETGILPLLSYNLPSTMYAENPVIIVSHSSNHIIPPQAVGEYGVVFKDTALKKAVYEAGLEYAVIGYEYTAQNSDLAATDRKIDFNISLLGTFVALSALLLGNTIMAIIYQARNRAAIFLLRTSGASFVETYGNFLIKNIFLAVIPISLIAATTMLPFTLILVTAVAMVIASFSTAILTLKYLERTLSRFALEFS
ncbi:MAG: hypothetical protein Q3965_04440 [Rothia sp. (in: high G+C Gram-positive bacteria)]|nr:hypothetical protein [Rothia sp. (in: high G+C Gram-positive bacteria)]